MPPAPKLSAIVQSPLSVILLPDGDTDPGPVVAQWREFLDARGQDYELFVPGIAGLLEPRLRPLAQEGTSGTGQVLRAALAQVRYPLVFYTLCRPEFRPEYLQQLLDRPFTGEEGEPNAGDREMDHVHLMSGYRAGVKVPGVLRILGGVWRLVCWVLLSYSPPPLPGWLGWRRHLGGLLARCFLGVRYRDVACPFRLFRRDILGRIPLQSSGPFVHVEFLAKANFLGLWMGEELPLDVRPGPYRGDAGQIWKDAWRVFHDPDFGPPVLQAEGGEEEKGEPHPSPPEPSGRHSGGTKGEME